MKTVKYEPEMECFTGTIEVQLDTYVNRLKLIDEMGMGAGREEEIGMEQVTKLVELAQERIVSVDITHESGQEFKSYEDLEYFEEGASLIQDVAQIALKGPSLGKKKEMP